VSPVVRAVWFLRGWHRKGPYLLLADIYEQQGKKDEAVKVCKRALEVPGLPERARTYFKERLEALQK